jgi:hypothetical protein
MLINADIGRIIAELFNVLFKSYANKKNNVQH